MGGRGCSAGGGSEGEGGCGAGGVVVGGVGSLKRWRQGDGGVATKSGGGGRSSGRDG
jgi:hypothetical protein